MPKNQNTSAQRAREAARQGAKYTQALRSGAEPPPAAGDDGFGGHEFEYESSTDLFRCTECRMYEVTRTVTRSGRARACPAGAVTLSGSTCW